MFGTVLPLSQRRSLSSPSLTPTSCASICGNPRFRAAALITTFFILSCILIHLNTSLDYYSISHALSPSLPDPSSSLSIDMPTNPTPAKEAYVLFLPTSSMDQWYLQSALILIFALKIDPTFRDPKNRDIVVLVSHLTSSADIAALQDAGAITRQIPYFVDSLFPSVQETLGRYRYTFNKIWAWDMEEYDRVLYMDADLILNRPMGDIWDDPHAWPESGLAATPDYWLDGQGSYFNSGLLLFRPNRTVLEELKRVELDDVFYPDQNLLNKYFSRDGDKPWEALNPLFQALHPTIDDIRKGAYSLQEKGWTLDDEVPEVKAVWWDWYGRMQGWKQAEKEAEAERVRAEQEARRIRVGGRFG